MSLYEFPKCPHGTQQGLCCICEPLLTFYAAEACEPWFDGSAFRREAEHFCAIADQGLGGQCERQCPMCYRHHCRFLAELQYTAFTLREIAECDALADAQKTFLLRLAREYAAGNAPVRQQHD